jgi:phage I-like protein
LLKAALSDGRLEPILKPWASTQPLAVLKAYLEAASPAAMLNKQSGKHAPNTAALTQEEAELCGKFGVTSEEFIAARKAGKE